MTYQDQLRSVAFDLARFSAFSAHALLFGLVTIVLLVLRPSFVEASSDEWARGRQRVARRLEGIVTTALCASLIATVVAFLLQVTLISSLERLPVGSNAFSEVLQTSFGQWYAARIPVLIALFVILFGRIRVLAMADADDSPRPQPWWWATWAALGFVLLATTTFSGHASTASPKVLAVTNDLVHLAAGSIWFAGVIVLAVILPDAWVGKPSAERARLLGPAVLRFSHVALIAISVVAVTGTINSLLQVAHPGDLLHAAYGLTLLIKIGLFLVILLMGAINHFYLRGRLRSANEGEPGRAQRLFRRTIAIELLVALAIMVASGVLTGQARTRQINSTQTEQTPAQNQSR
ncbi:MAG: CopD family protein [Actinomycetota bacterium]|nr:CopD family protein [Actinomycetota bacterium]